MEAGKHDDDDVLESRDFYETCYAYRTAWVDPVPAFEALKAWIRAHCIVSTDPTVDDKWKMPEEQ